MKFKFTQEEDQFRSEVRAFLRENLPADLAEREAQGFHLYRSELKEWQLALYEKGWVAPNWPAEFGGPGWTPIEKHIFLVEYGLANGPELSVIGLSLAGPVICRFGSDEMKATFLDPILRGDMWFCQGFSEPQAGSDLASLRTKAVLDGSDYVINGQKIWTTYAHWADYMICLCRTDSEVKPQAGLSMILVPMDAEGVTVRPILSINGEHELNEVFLEDVRVPVENLIGTPGAGWGQAKYLLNHERTYGAYLGILRRYLEKISQAIEVASSRGLSDTALHDYSVSLARLEIDVNALEWSILRVHASEGSPVLGAAASASKLCGVRLLLRAGELEMAIAGTQIAPQFERLETGPLKGGADEWVPGTTAEYLFYRASTIFGGAEEIQRGIIWDTLFRE